MRKGFVMRVGKIGVAVIDLFPFNVYGECTPTPDCASIGYTETSCEGDYLACPFDSTKLKCIPCDSSFRYDCVGENMIGEGNSCNGKYTACKCNSGYRIKDNVCLENCDVGKYYFSDGSCSNKLNNNKTVIGVVIIENSLIVSKDVNYVYWGGDGTDVDTLNNCTTSSYVCDNNSTGKINTSLIVAKHKSLGETAETSAAIYCNEYATLGTKKGDWYLPTAYELYKYLYSNASKLRAAWNGLNFSWSKCSLQSSSEYNKNYFISVSYCTAYGSSAIKGQKSQTVCFLEIN